MALKQSCCQCVVTRLAEASFANVPTPTRLSTQLFASLIANPVEILVSTDFYCGLRVLSGWVDVGLRGEQYLDETVWKCLEVF